MNARLACLVLTASLTAAFATGASPALSAPALMAQAGPGPPLPPPRPDHPAAAPGGENPPPQASPPSPPPGPSAEVLQCLDRLERLGVRFEVRPPPREGACGAADAVLVSGLPDGVEVAPPALMNCALAEALSRWTVEVLGAESERQLESAPTKVLIGTSYECRNQRSGGKLSEHAFADAVDVMGFEFLKRAPLSIGSFPDGSAEAGFQTAVRSGACKYFTTVLGPGSDAEHGNHLHLDLRARKAGYRICQ